VVVALLPPLAQADTLLGLSLFGPCIKCRFEYEFSGSKRKEEKTVKFD
jgi:hypothetical protein